MKNSLSQGKRKIKLRKTALTQIKPILKNRTKLQATVKIDLSLISRLLFLLANKLQDAAANSYKSECVYRVNSDLRKKIQTFLAFQRCCPVKQLEMKWGRPLTSQ